jgi:hypothetical protein
MNETNLPSTSAGDDEQLPVPNSTSPGVSPLTVRKIQGSALQPLHYGARVTRKDPAAIVILIDQSGSMQETVQSGYGSGKKMADVVAEIVNDLLDDLTMKCQKEKSIRDYFNLLIIGYGQEQTTANIAWEGKLKGKEWVLVSELKTSAVPTAPVTTIITLPWGEKREETRTKNLWISPYSVSYTPMHAAFELCTEKLSQWVKQHQDSFPPIVFNITDGQPTDCTTEQLVEAARRLTSLATKDGNLLLFNCLVTTEKVPEVLLPGEGVRATLHDEYHLALFDASSYLPDEMRNIAAQLFKDDRFKRERIKGVILNSALTSLIQLLNIGTYTTLSNTND